jgi:hypothetical protein
MKSIIWIPGTAQVSPAMRQLRQDIIFWYPEVEASIRTTNGESR